MRVPRLALVVSALAGCSLVVSSSGVDDQYGTADAGTTDGADVTSPDAGPCTGATFCDDFERTDLVGPWTDKSTSGATLDLFGDGGRSLRFAYAGADGGGGPAAYLLKDGFTGGHVSVGFAAYTDVGPGFFTIVMVRVEYGSKIVFSGGFQVADSVGSAVAQIFDDGAKKELFYDATKLTKAPPSKRWFRGLLDVAMVGTTATVTASIDGVVLAKTTAPNVQAGAVSIHAGCSHSSSAGGAGSVLIDDVRVDVAP